MLRFEFEWEDPGRAKGNELRATWSRFAIKIGDEYVTRVTDLAQRSVRDAVYLPLYPLAEWLAENWYFLQYEARTYESGDAFRRRHSFAWADAGYSYPQFSIQPTGRLAELIWAPKYKGYSTIEYIGRGNAIVELSNVVDELRALLEAIKARLEFFEIHNTYFQNEWLAISTLNDDEVEFARMAASSGLDPFDMEENIESTIMLLSERLPHESLARFLTATRDSIPERARWLEQSLAQLESLSGGLAAIPDIVARSSPLRLNQKKGTAPFEWGYDVARKIRAEIAGMKDPIRSVEHLAKLFDAKGFKESIVIDRQTFSQVKALSSADPSPRFKISTRRPDSDTFALARGIFDEITAPELGVNIVADTDLEADKASRAFAAEFLLPSSVLTERKAKNELWLEDDVAEIADEFHVSEYVVKHQIENHKIGILAH